MSGSKSSNAAPVTKASASKGPAKAEDFESKRQAQLADRAFARGIVSSSSYVDESAIARGGDVVLSAAALSKYTSSTDISRKSRKSTRYLFVLPGNLRLTGDGQIGQMDKMDGKNPTLSMPLPDGSTLVLCGSVIHSKTSFALLQLSQKSGSAMTCDEVFNSMVVFSEGYVENSSGTRVPLPSEFLKTSAAAADAFNALPRTSEKMPAAKRAAEDDNDNERYKANLLKRPRRGVEEDGDKGAASSSDSDAPISRAAIALAQEAAAAARARAEEAAPSLKKPSAFLADSSDEGETSQTKSSLKPKCAATGGQATLFSFLQGKKK